MALEIDRLAALSSLSTGDENKFDENWKHSNKCYIMIKESHMADSTYASILKMDNAKRFLEKIGKKIVKFDMNEKHHYYLDLLNNTKYDGIHGVREHILFLTSYFNKLKDLKSLVKNI